MSKNVQRHEFNLDSLFKQLFEFYKNVTMQFEILGNRRQELAQPQQLTLGRANQRQEGDAGPDGAEQVDVHHVGVVVDGAPLGLRPVRDSSVVDDSPQPYQREKNKVTNKVKNN